MSDTNVMPNDAIDKGKLRIRVTGRSAGGPVPNATIALSYTGNPSKTIEEVKTDVSGNSEELTLNTPPLEYSMEPGENQPYAQYTLRVSAPGYRTITVSGVEVMPEELSIQPIELDTEDTPGPPNQNIVIPANTLYGNFPPKIPESEVKPVSETGEIVLSRVVIPEFVIVHAGGPNDNTAQNYFVRYRDYIKNVASSEIYSTWPDATIRANVLAIMSFTLNRVYTEW